MKTGKKIASFILSLAMALTLLPEVAWAAVAEDAVELVEAVRVTSVLADNVYTITPDTLPAKKIGETYDAQFTTNIPGTVTWNWSHSQAQDIGLSFETLTGKLSGTAQGGYGGMGLGSGMQASSTSKEITITATNEQGVTVSKTYTQVVYSNEKYEIGYSLNGGTDADIYKNAEYDGGAVIYLAAAPVRTGYSFIGWNPEYNSTTYGTLYPANTSYTIAKGGWIYAQWEPIQYTVSYDLAGGTGANGADYSSFVKTIENSSAFALPAAPTREGYTFTGWSEDNGANLRPAGAAYYLRELITTETPTNITFVAQWKSTDTTAPLAIEGTPSVSLSYLTDGTTIAAQSDYTVTANLNRDVKESETVKVKLNYSDGSAKSSEFTMTVTGNRAAYTGKLPADAKSVTSVQLSLDNFTSTAATIDVGKNVGPTLNVTVSGTVGANSVLRVKNSGGSIVSSRSISAEGSYTFNDLPAGTGYTVDVLQPISGYGYTSIVSGGAQSATLSNGTVTTISLATAASTATTKTVTLTAKNESNESVSADFAWYDAATDGKLLASGSKYTFLSNQTVYAQATPKGAGSAYYDTTASRTAINAESADNVTLTLAKKPMQNITVSATLTDRSGSNTEDGKVTITVMLPGDVPTTLRKTVATGENATFTNVPAGATITASSAGTSYHGTATTTVASNITAYSLTVPLAMGALALEVERKAGDTTYRTDLESVQRFTLKKADGTVIAAIKNRDSLILANPSQVSAGDKLTLYAEQSGNRGEDEFPRSTGSTTLTLSNDGRLTASGTLTLVEGGVIGVTARRTVAYPFALLLYSGSGKLLWTKRDAVGNSTSSAVSLSTPYLPAGSYTVVMVNRGYLDTLAPEKYDTLSEAQTLLYKALGTATVTNGKWTGLDLTLPGDDPGTGRVNQEISGVSMSRPYAGYAAIDLTCYPTSDFNPTGNVTLYIATNQSWSEKSNSTHSLSINGKPFKLEGEFGTGLLNNNGVLSLKLEEAQIEEYGGFPMTVSAIIGERNLAALSAQAYLMYTQGGRQCTDFIGECYVETGSLSLEVPASVTDGEFTVYGRGLPSENGNPYTVTIYADGVPVATTQTDSTRGWYKAKLNLGDLTDGQIISFTASGAYTNDVDGSKQVNVSPVAECAYTPNDGALVKWELIYEESRGTTARTLTLLDDGDPVSLYKSYYRAPYYGTEGGVQWRMTFANPDKVKSVRVQVPRGDEVVTLEAVNQGDGTWLTPKEYFPGAAPDGASVSFDTVNEYPAASFAAHSPEAMTLADIGSAITAINAHSSIIKDLTQDTDGKLTFNLLNDRNEAIHVSITETTGTWDAEEIADLAKMEPVFANNANVIHYEEGYLKVADGVWGVDTIWRLPNLGADGKTRTGNYTYMRETYTMTDRTITQWDTATNTKTVSVTTLGDGEHGNPGLTAEQEQMAAYLQDYYRTDMVQEVWLAYMTCMEDALYETERYTDTATDSGTGNYSVSSYLTLAKIDIGKLQKAYNLAEKSYSWAKGKAITKKEIRKLKTFLEKNPCLLTIAQYINSTPYNGYERDHQLFDCISETNAVFGTLMTGEVASIALSSTTEFASGMPKNLIKKMVKGRIKQGAEGWATEMAFGSQGRNLAKQLFIAAVQAHSNSDLNQNINGLCAGEPLDLSSFPTDIYNYRKDFDVWFWTRFQRAPAEPNGKYDPSGYIFEAVPSNRVEGATVTLYHLDESANTAVLTDADYFGVEPNPQTTGADGRYQWFVPLGWWRVMAAKEGYESADTGTSGSYGLNAEQKENGNYYMPVLPVQLDVNIPLVSYAAPTVTSVSATTDGVFVTFSKYMDESTLTAANFTLSVGGATVTPTVMCENSEAGVASDGTSQNFSSIVKLTYSGMESGQTVGVTVDTGVRSYAGVPMVTSYTSAGLTVAAPQSVATPTASPAGGTVAKNTMMTLSTNTEGATIYYTTDGNDPTTSSTVYNSAIIIDRTLTIKAIAVKTGMANSEVMSQAYTVDATLLAILPARPSATINGAAVADNATVTAGYLALSTATPGASIYYTTNGVCPKEDPNPIQYTGPIYLAPGTYFFRIRARLNGEWSDGLPLHLTVVAGGSSSGGNGSVSSSPTATAIPASGESGALDVSATVNGSTATISPISDSAIASAVGTDGGNVGVVLDLTSLGRAVDTVSVPAASVQTIADALERNGGSDSLTVKTANGSVKLGENALSAVADAGGAGNVAFTLKNSGTDSLNAAQAAAVGDKEISGAYTLGVTSNGKDVGSLGGGFAEINVPFAPEAGTDALDYRVYRLSESGNAVLVPSTVHDGVLTVRSDRLEDIVIVRELLDESFSDIDTSAYYSNAALWAAANGVTNGVGNNLFAPDAACTRAQVVTFLWRAAGSPQPQRNVSGFSDVAADTWYSQAVAWAVENGITNGVGDSLFGTDTVCTRAQVVTFLYRLNSGRAADVTEFADVPKNTWYSDAVAWADANNITNGIDDNTFGTNMNCTRAQIVTFLYRDFIK